jgi:hypothetical protein
MGLAGDGKLDHTMIPFLPRGVNLLGSVVVDVNG